MTGTNLGPRTVIAVVRASLGDIEIWQKNGVGRDEIINVLTERFGVQITLMAFDKALYRARKEVKSGLHNPKHTNELRIPESKKATIQDSSELQNPDTQKKAKPVESGLHNPEPVSEKLVEDMGGNKEFLSDTDFQKIGDEAKKVASSFKGSVGNKKGF